MTFLEAGNFDAIFIIIIFMMFGPPILLTIIGFYIKKNNSENSKIWFILAGLYLIIGLGFCGSVLF